MLKGPQGQKRPADAVSAAVMVAKIATGKVKEELKAPDGRAGAKARAEKLTPQERSEIARKVAAVRWA